MNISNIFEEKWSAKVKTKWTPPEGFFKQSAEKIASGLKSASDDLQTAMGRLNFYINRAGGNLSDEDKARLDAAKEKLSKMYEDHAPMKMSDILENIEEAMKGFDPGLNLKKGDIAIGQAIGHMWKAAAELEAAGGTMALEQNLRKVITNTWKDVQSIDKENPGYMKALFGIAKTVYGRGSKLPNWATI